MPEIYHESFMDASHQMLRNDPAIIFTSELLVFALDQLHEWDRPGKFACGGDDSPPGRFEVGLCTSVPH